MTEAHSTGVELSPADVLRKAKALIDAPEKWTKGAYALNSDGLATFPIPSYPCRLCAIGALAKALGDRRVLYTEDHPAARVIYRVARVNGSGSLAEFNDDPDTGHADVMAMFDRAIELAESSHV